MLRQCGCGLDEGHRVMPLLYVIPPPDEVPPPDGAPPCYYVSVRYSLSMAVPETDGLEASCGTEAE